MTSLRTLAALFVAVNSISSFVAAATLTLLVEPASQEHHVGKVIFVELVTPNPAGAERFYGGLFGWTFHDIAIGQTEYAEALLNGHLVAGIARKDMPSGQRRQPAWLSFMAVNDVDAAGKAATENGAKLANQNVPNLGVRTKVSDFRNVSTCMTVGGVQ